MTWWQSLFIALIPAIITATISWLICNKQIQNSIRERKEKYAMEKRNYVSKIRFEKEFSIYQEISEKFITMVVDIGLLFPYGIYYEPTDEQEKEKYYKELYEKVQQSYNETASVINKYAILIPEKWHERFNDIRSECYLQARMFYESHFTNNLTSESDKIIDCYARTKKINESVKLLIKDLREYLESLDVKEK